MSDQKQFSHIELENGTFETRITSKFALRKPYKKHDPRIVKAVIPEIVAEISARVGMPVYQGDTLLILEAMKMLNRIMAPQDGTVKTIGVKVGEKVAKGQLLIQID